MDQLLPSPLTYTPQCTPAYFPVSNYSNMNVGTDNHMMTFTRNKHFCGLNETTAGRKMEVSGTVIPTNHGTSFCGLSIVQSGFGCKRFFIHGVIQLCDNADIMTLT